MTRLWTTSLEKECVFSHASDAAMLNFGTVVTLSRCNVSSQYQDSCNLFHQCV